MQLKEVVQPYPLQGEGAEARPIPALPGLVPEQLRSELPGSGAVGGHPISTRGKRSMEKAVRKLFERYESFFNRSLDGNPYLDEVTSLYASNFIAASPAGVMTGKNDDQLKQIMAQGYARYRAIGTRGMRIRHIRLSPIDQHHCVAHVAWTATYARKDQNDTSIDFDVHYLVQNLNGDARVFGWVSGDEQALLEKHGIV
jgi:hypothetical protein